MRSSDDITNLAAALVHAQADMPNVPKETMGQVGNQKRSYADLATVTETVRPILAKHGLAYVQAPSDAGPGFVAVTTRLLHESGQWIEDTLSMPYGNGGAQAVGSACTYGRRYSLMAMLGLAPEDDDGAAASVPARKPAKVTKPAATPADEPPPYVDPETGETAPKPVDKQTRQAMALFAELGVKDRTERLRLTSDIVGHDVGSWNDVPAAERDQVIDQLKIRKAARDG